MVTITSYNSRQNAGLALARDLVEDAMAESFHVFFKYQFATLLV